MLYRDIAFADTKAAFAMTIAGAGIAGAVTFFASTSSLPLGSRCYPVTVAGVVASLVGMLWAVLTVLPRRHVTSRSDRSRLLPLTDPFESIWSNIPFVPDQGNESLQKCIDDIANLKEETQRQARVRHRKYLWVGPSILMVALGLGLILVGVGMGVATILKSKTASVEKHDLDAGVGRSDGS